MINKLYGKKLERHQVLLTKIWGKNYLEKDWKETSFCHEKLEVWLLKIGKNNFLEKNCKTFFVRNWKFCWQKLAQKLERNKYLL